MENVRRKGSAGLATRHDPGDGERLLALAITRLRDAAVEAIADGESLEPHQLESISSLVVDMLEAINVQLLVDLHFVFGARGTFGATIVTGEAILMMENPAGLDEMDLVVEHRSSGHQEVYSQVSRSYAMELIESKLAV